MKVAFVGDLMLGRLVNDRLARENPAYPWGDVLPLLGHADVRIGNLECVLADDGAPWPGKVFHFRSDRTHIATLTAAGLTIVSLANNHVLDFGVPALRQILPTLDDHGVLHSGAGLDLDAARSPARCRVGDAGVSFLALTDNAPEWEAGPGKPGVHFVPIDLRDRRTRRLRAAVQRLSATGDLVVVSAHWGGNWGYRPPAKHRAFAHALIDAGAAVVFGHSPHVFRGVEVYRHRPILYSAGDFVDDYAVDVVERNDESFVFMLDAPAGSPARLLLHPTRIDEYQAKRAQPRDAARIARRMQRLCAELGTDAIWSDRDRCLAITMGQPCA